MFVILFPKDATTTNEKTKLVRFRSVDVGKS